jgi:two-component system CheB/CheR fusion protein
MTHSEDQDAMDEGVGPEQQLLETERRFQNMADASPVLLWMARADSLCTFFNETWLRFTGRTQEEEWGVGWAENVHFEDLQRCLDTYVDAFNARRVFEMEYRLRRADGVYRWVLDRGTPRYTPDGTFAGYIGSCVDIEDRKNAEAELRRALEVKEQFIDLISHELRTPLMTLVLQLEIFRQEGTEELTTLQGDLLGRMKVATDRLTSMIDSVLQLSRVERGRLVPQPTRIDLVELARQTLEDVRFAADAKGLELRLDGRQDIAPLVSDPDLVRLILSNLLANAVKFTERGCIEVALSQGRSAHRIAVRDTGPGIAPEQHKRIFEPFEQLGRASRRPSAGVGLGLSLVRSMAAALGGEVSVESELGRGSVFTVLVPPMIATSDRRDETVDR